MRSNLKDDLLSSCCWATWLHAVIAQEMVSPWRKGSFAEMYNCSLNGNNFHHQFKSSFGEETSARPSAKKCLEPHQLPTLYYNSLLSKETTAIDRLCSDRPLRLQSVSSLCEPVTSRHVTLLFYSVELKIQTVFPFSWHTQFGYVGRWHIQSHLSLIYFSFTWQLMLFLPMDRRTGYVSAV
jgi:hypothetical protein